MTMDEDLDEQDGIGTEPEKVWAGVRNRHFTGAKNGTSKVNGHVHPKTNNNDENDETYEETPEDKELLKTTLTKDDARFPSCPRGLLRIEHVPAHLQFNRFVHTGYRECANAWGCLKSLFYLHNETVNIFTHVAPILGVLLFWKQMYPWEAVSGSPFFIFLGWSHVLGSISPWMGSVTYHLFMNHHGGHELYTFLLQLDMFGIWVTQCFGALTNLYASTYCLSEEVQLTWMTLYGLASAYGLFKALSAWSPLGRRLCFAPVFISRIFGFGLRISKFGGGDPGVLHHVILQDVISILGGMIGVIRIPEKWFPGKLDIWFNSHHIMHIMVVLAVLHMNAATNGDIQWILENESKAACPVSI